MNLLWRFLLVFFISRFHTKLSLFDEGKIAFHVLPTDIDLLMHMNNGRYFSFMDLARLNFMRRNNAFSQFSKHQIYPVITAEMIRFKKSIHLLQRFVISSRMLGWDDKCFYVAHDFRVNNKICAVSVVQARFLHKRGPIDTKQVLHLLGEPHPSPPLPHWVKTWQAADQLLYESVVKR